MTEQTINNFLLINSKYFDMSMMPEVKLLLQNADESMAQSIFAIEFKDPTTLLIISILLGTYGIDRFMLGDVGMGLLKLFTGGSVWYSLDYRRCEYSAENERIQLQ